MALENRNTVKRSREDRPILSSALKSSFGDFLPPPYAEISTQVTRVQNIRKVLSALEVCGSPFLKAGSKISSRALAEWCIAEYDLPGSLGSFISSISAEKHKFIGRVTPSPSVKPMGSATAVTVKKDSPPSVIVVSDDDDDDDDDALPCIIASTSPRRPVPVKYPDECPICFVEWTDQSVFFRFQCKCKTQALCKVCIGNCSGLNGFSSSPNAGLCPVCCTDVSGTHVVSVGTKSLSGSGVLGFQVPFRPPKEGDAVRIKVENPRYSWGSVKKDAVGILVNCNTGASYVIVEFPTQKKWNGLLEELEVVRNK